MARSQRERGPHGKDTSGTVTAREREALFMMYGTREERHATFREWEAALIETIHRVCDRARGQSGSEEKPKDFRTP